MYGPIELRGTRPEHFDTSLSSAVVGGSCSHMSTYSGGSESGLPLWGSQKRFKVPFLEDPNTGIEMFESADIVEYVENTYALESK